MKVLNLYIGVCIQESIFIYFVISFRSAKSITKKPIEKKPRPESYDKATSTSDPLLEDDAVQVRQNLMVLPDTRCSCALYILLRSNQSKDEVT